MKTPFLSIIYFAIAAVLGALGQFLWKTGADKATSNLLSYINYRIIGGILCYVVVMLLFIAAFKKGGSLTVLYPIYASTFIWAAIISWAAFGIPIKPVNIGGMMLLIGGIYLMGR